MDTPGLTVLISLGLIVNAGGRDDDDDATLMC